MDSYHHNDLKHELMEKGLRLIGEEGIEKLSLRKLARMCNVSEAAPYSHFKNKDDLLLAMKDYVAEKLYEKLLAAYEASESKDDPYCILNIGKAYVDFALTQSDYFNFIFNQTNVKIDLSMQDDTGFKPFTFFRDKSYEVYRKAGLGDEEIKYGIISMWTQVHGIAMIASMKNVSVDFNWMDVLDRLLVEGK